MRKTLVLTAVLAVLGGTAAAMALPVDTAFWRFDNGAVPVPDSSPNGNTLVHSSGTYSWTTDTWQDIDSPAIRFPTDSATNDGLQCNNGNLGNVDPGATGTPFAISIALVIKPDTIPSGHLGEYWVVQKMNYCDRLSHTSGTLGVGWGIFIQGTRAWFCFYDKDGKYKEARSDNVIDANETWFICVTHDYSITSASSGYTNWYINDGIGSGMIHDGTLHSGDQMKTGSQLVSVGYPLGGTGRTTRGYCGMVDDVSIWDNVLLSSSEVNEAYLRAKLPEPVTLALLLCGLPMLLRRRR